MRPRQAASAAARASPAVPPRQKSPRRTARCTPQPYPLPPRTLPAIAVLPVSAGTTPQACSQSPLQPASALPLYPAKLPCPQSQLKAGLTTSTQNRAGNKNPLPRARTLGWEIAVSSSRRARTSPRKVAVQALRHKMRSRPRAFSSNISAPEALIFAL